MPLFVHYPLGARPAAACASAHSQRPGGLLYVCPGVFCLRVLIGVLLKGVIESCLLSKDELLTSDIDEVMAV